MTQHTQHEEIMAAKKRIAAASQLAREQAIDPVDDNIIDDILRQFSPKVPRGMGPGQWTEDEYASAETLEQRRREAGWLEARRAMEEEAAQT